MRVIVRPEGKKITYYLDDEDEKSQRLIPLGFMPNPKAANEGDKRRLAMLAALTAPASIFEEAGKNFEFGLTAMAKALGHDKLEIRRE
ncbi:MAG: hypothetical protein A3J65_01410 [Candidatus Buchananbacteria bacterium RIFCSPHIGHO2_02_FULL_45_11b]|uniref:Uncharacterized protein n=4 Tax=Candidatus Buchananiibacteriota TaxID=1817903 RepID=A0A1G1YF93_9BACT|nr:MAG: hypothetical protein A2663_01850 [Candidatus Buchananbacteria bacterium RIFCSPHIGHO2_01_FULL_46_12]OGY51013.1 MAG: hypothetical protein A3J65_01410 [Candidatus Buchananbacteria bacterium RIFCSPHIGHO2_02_FULL_45_11b]OGY52926.1 MAG: hypothetical protein A3B15_02275 [Candidatus Buchananbacteria bacterium RIFCSPLOWO2_01_FULL_45_31]OGY56864.1 MAG: hypothetical protein A3H67_01970 [Candidatus Buchananbacteria bacterium RIFCSPLOWO2_02_FULL_46_11b]